MSSFRKNGGYTLMELLTVIAIIGVLASLIFPVAAGARKRAREAQCMNNMMQIFTAIEQFKLDERRYPEFIAGPVQFRDGSGNISYTSGTLVPLEETTGIVNGRAVSLFPEYVPLTNNLKCPFGDLNGDQKVYNPADVADTVPDPMYNILNTLGITDSFRAVGTGSGPYRLYKFSSYDYQKPMYRSEDQVHYSPAWAKVADPANPRAFARQLRWRTPPKDTVITWCSHHRVFDGSGNTNASSRDIVLYLDGHAKKVRSDKIDPAPGTWWQQGWLVLP